MCTVNRHSQNSVTNNRCNIVTFPWPTRSQEPISEFTTIHIFTLAFPCLFPYGAGDFHVNHPQLVSLCQIWQSICCGTRMGDYLPSTTSLSLLCIISLQESVLWKQEFHKQQLGDKHLSTKDLKMMIAENNVSIRRKFINFGSCLRGSSQYWSQRARELRSLIQFQIN